MVYIVISRQTKSLIAFLKKFPGYSLIAGLVGLTLGLNIYFWGISLTNAAYAATIFSSNPIFVSLISIIFLKESKTKKKFIGIFLGFFGVLLIVTELNFKDLFNQEYLLGNLLSFLGMILWIVDIILGKVVLNKSKSLNIADGKESQNFNAITMIISGITLLPVIFFTDGFQNIHQYSLNTWFLLIYLGIFTAGLGYLFFFKGLNLTEASTGINAFYFKPFIATILSYFIFDYIPSIFLIIGLIIELSAIILVSSS